MRSETRRIGEWRTEFLIVGTVILNWMDGFMLIFLSFSPLRLILRIAGPEGAKNLAGICPPPDSDPFSDVSLEKTFLGCQANSPQPQTADSSARKAVSFSSERTTKRFPSSRCASATNIVRPSTAETQPQLQPDLLRLSALNREL